MLYVSLPHQTIKFRPAGLTHAGPSRHDKSPVPEYEEPSVKVQPQEVHIVDTPSPTQPPAPPLQPFVYEFLSGVSQKAGEDCVLYDHVFLRLGISERRQFQNLLEDDDAMNMVKERLEQESVSFYIVTMMVSHLKKLFAKAPV